MKPCIVLIPWPCLCSHKPPHVLWTLHEWPIMDFRWESKSVVWQFCKCRTMMLYTFWSDAGFCSFFFLSVLPSSSYTPRGVLGVQEPCQLNGRYFLNALFFFIYWIFVLCLPGHFSLGVRCIWVLFLFLLFACFVSIIKLGHLKCWGYKKQVPNLEDFPEWNGLSNWKGKQISEMCYQVHCVSF